MGFLGVSVKSEFDDLHWRQSSFCEAGACLELARAGDVVLLRLSDQPGTVLALTQQEVAAFVAGFSAGDFD
jgi:Domain of unknown function (DUF397)